MAFSPKSVIQILWSRHRPSDGDVGRRNPRRVLPSGNRIQGGGVIWSSVQPAGWARFESAFDREGISMKNVRP